MTTKAICADLHRKQGELNIMTERAEKAERERDEARKERDQHSTIRFQMMRERDEARALKVPPTTDELTMALMGQAVAEAELAAARYTNEWTCAQCGFVYSGANPDAQCPNDGTPLRRLTWEAALRESRHLFVVKAEENERLRKELDAQKSQQRVRSTEEQAEDARLRSELAREKQAADDALDRAVWRII